MSPGQRQMFLHVGAPKTGTTYLQTVLWASRRQLREQGLTLPMRRVEEHVHMAQDVRELYDDMMYSPRARGGLDRFAKALGHVQTPRALFSMEIIAPATPEQRKRLYDVLDGFEIHIIITARDLARQIPSGWQQRMQRRVHTSYDQYLARALDDPEMRFGFWRSQDYAEVAARWRDSRPAEHVHIVTVPPAGSPKHLLLERFCSVIGVDPATVKTDTAQSNSSLAAPQAELMRRVNEALGERLQHRRRGYNRVGKGYFAKEVLAAQSGPPLKLPARYADRCREISHRIIADIRAGGYDVVGDLADLEPVDFGQTAGDMERFSADANEASVAEAGVQALATMLEQRYEDLLVIEDLRKRLGEPTPDDESWAARQRRRLTAVRDDPSVVMDRLPRPRRR